MANSEGLEARYSAIIDGIASLTEMQPSYPSLQVSRITSGSGGLSGRVTSSGNNQPASFGRPSSRAGNSASLRQPDLSADSAAFHSTDSQRAAVQPVFRSTARTKTARPESRDRRTSAWAAQQHNASEEQRSQLDTNSWMSGDALSQSSRAMDCTLPGYRPQPRPLSRQVTASQAATIRNDSDQGPCRSSAHKLRPSSAQRQSSAKASQRPPSRQQAPSVHAGGAKTMYTSAWPHLDVWVSLVPDCCSTMLHSLVELCPFGSQSSCQSPKMIAHIRKLLMTCSDK